MLARFLFFCFFFAEYLMTLNWAIRKFQFFVNLDIVNY